MLEMKGIRKSFGRQKRHEREVLTSVDFHLGHGETLALMGESGSGKSTVARILLLLERADGGEIHWEGERLDPSDRGQVKRYRRRVQYISQHPESFFDPSWRLGKSVAEPLGLLGMDRKEADRIPGLLEQLKVNGGVLERYPHQVSGGEIQRLAICRALLLKPRVLVLDEATSMLDVSVQAQIISILQRMKEENGLSYLFISHDEELVRRIGDRVLYLREGRLFPFPIDKGL